MAVDPRSPCIIGVAQRTWHLAGDEQAPEPLDMWSEVVRAAAADCGAGAGCGAVLEAADRLAVVYCMSWPYDDPPGRLAERLAIDPRSKEYSGIGGTVPQQLLSSAAADIVAGDLGLAVVCGAEALDTKRRLKKAGERPAWSHRKAEKEPFPFEAPFHPAEVAHEVFQAWLTFAVRDVARRADLNVAPDAYREQLGELLAPMTEVAAKNPHAWFPAVRTVDELITATPANRMVGYPYTKTMVSVMDVDMASAAIMASHEVAERLGVPADQRVYLRGSHYAIDPTYVAEHPDLGRSPAMAAAFSSALRAAGVGIDDVAHLDLYSCFSSSVLFACDALGIDPVGDDRRFTVTGGLPFAGGPASNYMGHSVAAMVDRLRHDPGSLGMVSGVGMHMTKHTAAVYSTEPGRGSVPPPAGTPPGPATVPIVDTYEGPATVAAYTVAHRRDGEPASGLAIVDLPDGAGRAYARTDGDAGLLAEMEATEFVGRQVILTTDGQRNRFCASNGGHSHRNARRNGFRGAPPGAGPGPARR